MEKFKILIILMVFIFMNSCKNDFLDLVPFTSESAGGFYQTEEQMNQAVMGCYSTLQSYTKKAWIFEEMQSDNTTIDFTADAGTIGNKYSAMTFQMESDNTDLRDVWRILYNGISNVNYTLSKLPESEASDAAKKQFDAELKFLRAYIHFVAVRYWGDIPLVTKPVSVDDAFSLGKSSVDEVYAQIINDLKDAEAGLPVKYSNNADLGRVTKGAALTMLGHVYLTKHEYANAVTELRKVQNSGAYQLATDYKNIWGVANENGPESIFEVQYMEGEEYGQYNEFQRLFSPLHGTKTGNYPTYTGGAYNIPTKSLLAAYEQGDLRYTASIVTETVVEKYPTGVDSTFVVGATLKYFSANRTVANHNGNNWIVYRYADVLLMLAEALNEQGYNAESFALINQIRSRAGLEGLKQANVTDQSAFRLAIEHERRVEFAFENKRWFDLVRTGRAIDVITAFGQAEIANPTTPVNPVHPVTPGSYIINDFELIFPIPVEEIKINDIGQNPGYN